MTASELLLVTLPVLFLSYLIYRLTRRLWRMPQKNRPPFWQSLIWFVLLIALLVLSFFWADLGPQALP